MATRRSQEFADYWNEFADIEQSKNPEDPEEELSKTPDEGEIEATWLQQAGYGHLVSQFQAGEEFTEDELEAYTSSLTRSQAEVVKKRVETLSATFQKRQRHNKTDVRTVFANNSSSATESLRTAPTESMRFPDSSVQRQRQGGGKSRDVTFLRRGAYSMSGRHTNQVQDNSDADIETLSFCPKSTFSQRMLESMLTQMNDLPTITDAEVMFDFQLDEKSSTDDNLDNSVNMQQDEQKERLPNFVLIKDHLGTTDIRDVSDGDLLRVRSLALIELTSLLDRHNIIYSHRKRKKKYKDHGLFGVPLHTLLEIDQRKDQKIKTPLIFQNIIYFLEEYGLKVEGILRVPGAAGRIKLLREDLEEKFYQGSFRWQEVWPNDAAALMKQFLRELPIPLLTNEYIEAFAQVENITDKEEQLKVLNLLVLLLPDSHRDTLQLLLKFLAKVVCLMSSNKMSLSNVSMIMAPNLFLSPANPQKTKSSKEVELSMAAGTSSVVRMLIRYHHLLWTIPSFMIAQIRHQYDIELQRRIKEKTIMKFLGKKDKNEVSRKPSMAHETDFQGSVIRVHAPALTKSGAAIQLDPSMTAGDIVAKFRRTSDTSPPFNGSTEFHFPSSHMVRSFSNPDNATFAEDNTYLHEVGGNIGERCLDHKTNMMAIFEVNPNAEWVIKKRNH